jgi:hypothetical protein
MSLLKTITCRLWIIPAIGIGTLQCFSPSDSGSNSAPLMNALTDKSAYVYENIGISITASDPDNDQITFSATGLPGGMQIDPASGRIWGAAAISDSGVNTITVTASDGRLKSSSTFILRIVVPTLGTDQFVRVLKPNGGEAFRYGDTVEVLWLMRYPPMDEAVVKLNMCDLMSDGEFWVQLPRDLNAVGRRSIKPLSPADSLYMGVYRFAARDTNIAECPIAFGTAGKAVGVYDPYGEQADCMPCAVGDYSDAVFTVTRP